MQIVPIHEFNTCHEPPGSSIGGQFCSGTWSVGGRILTARRARRGELRPATATEKKRHGVPPAYTDVRVSTDPKSEVLWSAKDAKGHTHYGYRASYNQRQEAAKWSRVKALDRQMPTLMTRVDKDIRRGVGPAYTLRLIALTGLRNGSESAAEEAGTFGASSLLMEHVSVEGDTLTLTFPGKGGKAHERTLTDPVLAEYVRERESSGATRLFEHTDADTLAYMKRVSGGKFKVHDLRTWVATTYADRLVQAVVRSGLTPKTQREYKALRKEVGTRVAEALGNTPAIALKSYILPTIFRPLEVS